MLSTQSYSSSLSHFFSVSAVVSAYRGLSDKTLLGLRSLWAQKTVWTKHLWGKTLNSNFFTSFCRLQKFLIVLLAHINLLFQLCYIGARKYLGFLAIFQKVFKTRLQITQNLLVFTRQHRLYLKETTNAQLVLTGLRVMCERDRSQVDLVVHHSCIRNHVTLLFFVINNFRFQKIRKNKIQ
jgi:hypothetical protein